MLEELAFFSTVFVCISLGNYYKRIEDTEAKKNYGAGLGLLVACVITGHYVYHLILMVWGNIVIMKCCNKKYIHHICLSYTWLYLAYLHWNVITSVYMRWLYQTIAMRLVGIAFEIRLAQKKKDPSTQEPLAEEPNATDIICYSLFFVGLHRGPYYRYKTFVEHFESPFGVLGDCRIITVQKIKKASVCALLYFMLKVRYQPEAFYDDQFYESHGAEYLFWYCTPQLLEFFLFRQMVMMLCTSVSTEAGFGVYPAKCNAIPGHGPTQAKDLIKHAASDTKKALEQEYNFAMLKCYDNGKVLLGPKMKNTLKGWEMSTRYWFWAYTYKSMLKSSKEVRHALSFVMWTLWSGSTIRTAIVSATLWVYVNLEKEYQNLYDTENQFKKPWNFGFSLMRLFCLIYLTPCFMVEDSSMVLRFYNQIYWVYHIVLLLLLIQAFLIHVARKRSTKFRPDASPETSTSDGTRVTFKSILTKDDMRIGQSNPKNDTYGSADNFKWSDFSINDDTVKKGDVIKKGDPTKKEHQTKKDDHTKTDDSINKDVFSERCDTPKVQDNFNKHDNLNRPDIFKRQKRNNFKGRDNFREPDIDKEPDTADLKNKSTGDQSNKEFDTVKEHESLNGPDTSKTSRELDTAKGHDSTKNIDTLKLQQTTSKNCYSKKHDAFNFRESLRTEATTNLQETSQISNTLKDQNSFKSGEPSRGPSISQGPKGSEHKKLLNSEVINKDNRELKTSVAPTTSKEPKVQDTKSDETSTGPTSSQRDDTSGNTSQRQTIDEKDLPTHENTEVSGVKKEND